MAVELPESIINGRFKYLEKPAAAPGKCSVCGVVNKPVIDFGLDIDYYGVVAICTECMRSAMMVVDLCEGTTTPPVVPPLNFLDVEAVNEYISRANVSLTALNAILASTVSSLVDAETAEKSDRVSDEAERADEQFDKSSVTVSVSEGPSSVPTSSSNESSGVFDF